MKRKFIISEFERLNDQSKDVNRRRRVVFAITLIFSVLFIFLANKFVSRNLPELANVQVDLYRAKVTAITDQKIKGSQYVYEDGTPKGFEHYTVLFQAEFKGGPMAGKTVTAVQDVVSLEAGQEPALLVKGGETVFIGKATPGAAAEWSVYGFERLGSLLVLFVFFSLLIVVFGRLKGFTTLVSLVLTCAAVFFILIPAVLSGYNPYLWTFIVSIYIIVMSLLIINGLNEKTVAAGLASVLGMLVAALLMLIINTQLKMTGFIGEEAMHLSRINPNAPINVKAILYAAIMLGATGAVMDVSMDIASSLQEVAQSQGQGTGMLALLKSGFEIGKDSIGTMVNTLILAYVGGSFVSLLLLVALNMNNLYVLLNSEGMIAELLQMLIGAFSMLFTIPFATVLAAFLYSRRARRKVV